MVRLRIYLPFLHFIFQFILLFKAIWFWTVIPCQCISLYSPIYAFNGRTYFIRYHSNRLLPAACPGPLGDSLPVCANRFSRKRKLRIMWTHEKTNQDRHIRLS